MVADTNTPAKAASEESAVQADAVVEAAAKAEESASKTASQPVAKKPVAKKAAAKKAAAKTKTRRSAKPATAARRKAKRSTGKSRKQSATPTGRREERNNEMKFDTMPNMFANFGAMAGANPFESLLGDASQRGEDVARRSRKAAEEFAEIARGNVDAFVEAGKIAANGAQSIGQRVAAKSRDSIEQTANSVRSFAEAKSPTELLQLHSDFVRTSFDRFVENSSNLTESMVKLAGEALQPISNRTSANVEKINEIAG